MGELQLPSIELLEKKLPEWILFEKLLADLESIGRVHVLGVTSSAHHQLPLIAMSFGSQDPKAPVLALFGGVHGLERIGSQVVLALMRSFSELLLWDQLLQDALSKLRVVFFPMVNPLGIMNMRRANPNGVDLMRNSPITALEKPTFLVGGHLISPKLPWYRGHNGMEPESQALIQLCKEQFFESSAVVTVDFHSGFGTQDRLWFPYAKTREPFPHLPEMYALSEKFERTFPNHFYRIEPQAKNYTTHGDLWDYLYDEYMKTNSGTYLSLTLEMGSWMWVRKNPLQLFSSLGPYHPIKPHRQKRILRRHITLFDFLVRTVISHSSWSSLSSEQRNKNKDRAYDLWYPHLEKK